MQEHQKSTVKRILYASVTIIAAALLIFAHYEIRRGVNYSVPNNPISNLSDQTETVIQPIPGIEEPEDLSHVIRLTIGGNCTPAAVLGTDSFGTFNRMAEDEGREIFFADLNKLFGEDDCTVLGCAAVLSDSELSFDETSSETLPFIGPAKNAEVFTLSSVEALSLANARAELCGEQGITETQNSLEKSGAAWFDENTPFYFEKYGITVGIMGLMLPSASDGSNYTDRIAQAANQCDFLILYAERGDGDDEAYSNLAKEFTEAGCALVCFTGGGQEEKIDISDTGIIVDSLGYLLDGSIYTGEANILCSVAISVKQGAIEKAEAKLIPVIYKTNSWFPSIVPVTP